MEIGKPRIPQTPRSKSTLDQRMRETNPDRTMKAKEDKRSRDLRTKEDHEEQASKYATVEIEDKEGSIRNIMWVCSFATNQDFFDDVTGKKLDKELVLQARAEQIGEVKKFQVYLKVPIQNCWNDTGTDPVGVRWLNVNKGDTQPASTPFSRN